MWKPLPSRHVLKTLRGSPKGKAERGQYLLTVSLGCYKWYQSQTLGDVPAKRLSPRRGWTRAGVPARTLGPEGGRFRDPTSVGEENETPFIRVWKPLPSRRVLKALRENPKGKVQRRQRHPYIDQYCSPKESEDEKTFKFGMFVEALKFQLTSTTSFRRKFFYSFWWALRNVRSVKVSYVSTLVGNCEIPCQLERGTKHSL